MNAGITFSAPVVLEPTRILPYPVIRMRLVLLAALLLLCFVRAGGRTMLPPDSAASGRLQPIATARANDSTGRSRPSVESMLEEAGDDQLGASVFIDEVEYYRAHPDVNPRGIIGEDVPAFSPSPFGTDISNVAQDSADASSARAPYDSRQFFPLQAEREHSYFATTRVSIRSTIEKDFTETQGARENKWSGSPVHSVQRIQLSNAPASAGFILEHDPGENFSNGFFTGYASVHGIGIIDQLVAGAYTVNAGEGLVLSRASLFSKGTMSITQTKKYGAALVPYLSRDEFNYFRGAAGSLRSGVWSLTAFYSHRPLPATTNDEGAITSFYASGLFRSANETGKINAVTETASGLIATVAPLPAVSVTLSSVAAGYDRVIAASCPYGFEGSSMRAVGLAFNAAVQPLAVFGEIAGHGMNSFNGVLGTIYRAAPNFAFAVHLRSYSARYNNPFARAFSDRGEVNGERGVYAGFDWNIARALGLFAYVDHFSIDDPLVFNKQGVEYVLRLDGAAAKNFSSIVQMKYKTHSLLTEPDDALHAVIDEHRQATLRFQVRYTSAGQYTFTQRCNFTRVSYSLSSHSEKGILLATDIAKQYRDIGLGWRAGIVFFDTDSYASGLSMYEPDVRGAASTSMLFGQGSRWFIMADYAVSAGVRLSLKFGSLSKWNVATLGSGDDETLGNTDPQLTFQADISL
jgi:hypothetical protein